MSFCGRLLSGRSWVLTEVAISSNSRQRYRFRRYRQEIPCEPFLVFGLLQLLVHCCADLWSADRESAYPWISLWLDRA